MVPMPKTETSTVKQVYKAYEESAEDFDSLGIALGDCSNACDRSIWYALRWACEPEPKSGRVLRRFETERHEKERLASDLRLTGVTIKGQQERVSLAGGHVRGKLDGRGLGVLEAPKTEHVIYLKAVNLKTMKALDRYGVKKAKPGHYAQMQLTMHALGLTRAIYFVACTNDDSLHSERIDYDIYFSSHLISRLSRIIGMDKPPSGVCNGPNDFRGVNCKQRATCMDGELMRHSCRSCIQAKADMDGDSTWTCRRFERPLSPAEQKQACPSHLNVPETVPGKQVDCSPQDGTITYEMPNGSIWIDGEK